MSLTHVVFQATHLLQHYCLLLFKMYLNHLFIVLFRFFIGTSVSTFSFRIHEEREILGFDPKTTYNRFCGDTEKECEQPTHWKIVYWCDLSPDTHKCQSSVKSDIYLNGIYKIVVCVFFTCYGFKVVQSGLKWPLWLNLMPNLYYCHVQQVNLQIFL